MRIQWRHQTDKVWTTAGPTSFQIPDKDYWVNTGMIMVEDYPGSGLIYWRKR